MVLVDPVLQCLTHMPWCVGSNPDRYTVLVFSGKAFYDNCLSTSEYTMQIESSMHAFFSPETLTNYSFT